MSLFPPTCSWLFWKCPSFLEIYYGNPRWEGVEWIQLAQDRVQMCANMMQKILTVIRRNKGIKFEIWKNKSIKLNQGDFKNQYIDPYSFIQHKNWKVEKRIIQYKWTFYLHTTNKENCKRTSLPPKLHTCSDSIQVFQHYVYHTLIIQPLSLLNIQVYWGIRQYQFLNYENSKKSGNKHSHAEHFTETLTLTVIDGYIRMPHIKPLVPLWL